MCERVREEGRKSRLDVGGRSKGPVDSEVTWSRKREMRGGGERNGDGKMYQWRLEVGFAQMAKHAVLAQRNHPETKSTLHKVLPRIYQDLLLTAILDCR